MRSIIPTFDGPNQALHDARCDIFIVSELLDDCLNGGASLVSRWSLVAAVPSGGGGGNENVGENVHSAGCGEDVHAPPSSMLSRLATFVFDGLRAGEVIVDPERWKSVQDLEYLPCSFGDVVC